MSEIIGFPQARRIGKARHVAATIARRHSARDRDVYYRAICKQLAEQLRRIGIEEVEIDRQVAAFTTVVNRCVAEGWHFEELDNHQGPGAA